jgi:hypothetical protein
MKILRLLPLVSAILGPIHAGELPQLSEQPWLGSYAGYERRDFQFRINIKGEGVMRTMGDKKDLISERFAIDMQPLIEEVLADGKVVSKVPADDGWEAVSPASVNPKAVTYRGTVNGNARFEVTFEFNGDEIRAGGRILDKGELKNPRFVIRVKFPNVYYYDEDAEKREDKAKRDRIDLVRTDRKKLKLDVLTPLDAESAEFSGPGIAQARIDLAGYKGHEFELDAGSNAAFEFWNRDEEALYKGFTLGWKPDPAKDPGGKARCVLKLR